ncbi:MAG: 3-deoxy-D-manno-octulosonic acid transferase [Bacteroidetes bacterium]|jgi:3-deoxy-D-manno-octulosonic-acid transferase|nr:3-deoxy-D-manno-octulosonic acid transferase [Bacteroidota bacterium]
MFFYTFAIRCYHLLARLLSPFNKKARLFTEGRKGLLEKIRSEMAGKNEKRIWVHCASLGEFEQGRPVIEKLKQAYPAYKIVLTFFSPSGYEQRKDYEFADYVYYLPMDSKANARAFVAAIKPSLAIFVKYEFWLNYLNELHRSHTPTLLISGIFRPDQHFFKWYGGIFKRSLFYYRHLFLQNAESLKLLNEQGISNCSVAGDTRFDRVIEIARQPKQFEEIRAFAEGHLTILCGSTWAEDEKYLLQSFRLLKKTQPTTRLIIAPHNIEQININQLLSLLKSEAPELSYEVYTQWDKKTGADLLIVDTIGMLSSLYQYAQIAYIGGGFGSGIHNILEALVYGIPVVFGPNYHKFHEATASLDRGISYCFHTREELDACLGKLAGAPGLLQEIREKSGQYIRENSGSSDKIIGFIKTEGLL